jgi:hypothetical protein
MQAAKTVRYGLPPSRPELMSGSMITGSRSKPGWPVRMVCRHFSMGVSCVIVGMSPR